MKKNIKFILMSFGIFLILDGILSIYFGNACLNNCANNNLFGNFVRGIRTIIGLTLVYISFKR